MIVGGTEAAGIVLPELAHMRAQNRTIRANELTRVEELATEPPLHLILDSMPWVGIRTEARILTEVSGQDFTTAGLLASNAGLAPVTWRSRTSIRADHSSRTGNNVLERDLFLSAFATLKCQDQVFRAYSYSKRVGGKKHNQVVIVMARLRCNVLLRWHL